MNRDDPEPEAPSESAHHVYDGIVEHDNKLPLWWQLTLYGAVLFALCYWFGRRLDAIESPRQAYESTLAAEHAAAAERARARGTVDDAMLSAIAKDPATLAQGKDVFVSTCAACHKADAGGNIGPNLTDEYWIHGNKPTDIYKTVTEGVPAKGMPTWAPVLGEQRVEAVVAYVISIENTHVPGGKAPQGELASR
ncbi:MAG TPA: c-type cytochrome [Polyangiaceae bacterium]|jgi:cytochrome c oxidase cbb3-type subunit 3